MWCSLKKTTVYGQDKIWLFGLFLNSNFTGHILWSLFHFLILITANRNSVSMKEQRVTGQKHGINKGEDLDAAEQSTAIISWVLCAWFERLVFRL